MGVSARSPAREMFNARRRSHRELAGYSPVALRVSKTVLQAPAPLLEQLAYAVLDEAKRRFCRAHGAPQRTMSASAPGSTMPGR